MQVARVPSVTCQPRWYRGTSSSYNECRESPGFLCRRVLSFSVSARDNSSSDSGGYSRSRGRKTSNRSCMARWLVHLWKRCCLHKPPKSIKYLYCTDICCSPAERQSERVLRGGCCLATVVAHGRPRPATEGRLWQLQIPRLRTHTRWIIHFTPSHRCLRLDHSPDLASILGETEPSVLDRVAFRTKLSIDSTRQIPDQL